MKKTTNHDLMIAHEKTDGGTPNNIEPQGATMSGTTNHNERHKERMTATDTTSGPASHNE